MVWNLHGRSNESNSGKTRHIPAQTVVGLVGKTTAMSQIIHFGVLLLPNFQWLDAAGPIEYINYHSNDIFKRLGLAESITDKAPTIEWYFISFDLTPVYPTSGPAHIPTHTYDDCPALDYLLVPGPDPIGSLPDGCISFLRRRSADPRLKALLLVCTASLAVAQTGILNEHYVCANKYALLMIAKAGIWGDLKEVKWLGDRRWHIDRKIWSSAGVTAGIDLAAEFAKQHFDREVVKLARDVTEYDSKPARPDIFARLLDGIKLR